MNYTRAIRTGVAIWMIGVTLFTIATLLPISNDPELQGNLTLAISFLPLAWFGSRYYFKSEPQTQGYQLALVLAVIAIVLDALITVPLFFLPHGIGYVDFFGAPGFWILMVEYTGVVLLYDYLRRRRSIKHA
ncbi:DUF5367 family protein [Aureitalea sp. L0-47]|uniref:DUF5367 domain-containing protein n=1 Tax=Aureitalea sp. L0-47 TaxID=2816962 RepID=UPI002238ECB4|nr:DUF5367 domain-containing protein [Aureitalea sp. L0-47]MCW5518898.1 DUF5367 family protein [Aureitalea sp. L0-47]